MNRDDILEITRLVVAQLADKRGYKIMLPDYVKMTGSVKQTARTLGVPYASLLRWLNGSKPSKSWMAILDSRGVSWRQEPK